MGMYRVIALFLCVFMPAVAFAHSGQPSFEVESGSYLIDIGYDVTGIRPGEEVTFDFDLYQDVNGVKSFALFDAVHVGIAREGETIHTEQLHNQESFIPMMKFTFPDEGVYSLAASYVQSGAVIADTTIDLPVAASNGAVGRAVDAGTYVLAAVLTVLAAVIAVTSFVRARGS